jgi:divalent metal cation (Fe/Co/Zn/Cd) transporter
MGEPIDPGAKEVDALARHTRSAGRFLQGLLVFVAGFIVIFSAGLMFAIGGGRSHLAGRLTVAIAALVFLGWLDTQATRLARRREPILLPDSAGYRRFVFWSALGQLLAVVLLLGLAWLLP